MEAHFDLKPFTIPGQQSPDQALLVAGPCSAESEEQLLKTAQALKKEKIHLFRAGIWKPRTRPGDFQGLGAKALPWLQKVRETTGLPVATEVANEKHVYQALKYNIDVLWIGARTTANPFAVEEIANSLVGIDIPVMVKNPINPDLKLWLGAIERLNKKGIKRIAAVHRGFSSFERSPYRNPPKWNIPEQLKNILPEIPVLNDPSHIGGNRQLLFKISRKAMEKHFDGLMIEVHPDPENALSDSLQQITPADFNQLICRLGIEVKNKADSSNEKIRELRNKVDFLDDELLDIIEKRMHLVQKIGNYKKQRNLSIFQKQRFQELLSKRVSEGTQRGLDADFVKDIFNIIHCESVKRQKSGSKHKPEKFCDQLTR